MSTKMKKRLIGWSIAIGLMGYILLFVYYPAAALFIFAMLFIGCVIESMI